jgi:hypothetical protein
MSGVDRTVAGLCLAILEGEPDTRLILADRLEEMGEGLSSAVRELRTVFVAHGHTFAHRIRDPFDLVLHALPADLSWRLMCDVAEHALPHWEREFPDNPAPQLALAARRGWLEGHVTEAELIRAREKAWNATTLLDGTYRVSSEHGVYFVGRPAAHAARACARGGGGDARAALRAAASDAQRAVAEALFDNNPSATSEQLGHAFRGVSPEERSWQWNRLRQCVRELATE